MSPSAFFDDPEKIRDYLEADISNTRSCFWILSDYSQVDFSTFHDSTEVEFEGRPARIDVLNISNKDADMDYYTYSLSVQSMVSRLEQVYRPGGYLQENVNSVLDNILCLYGADRAFIFEVDFGLNYVMDLYERFRPGFEAK